MNELEPTSSSQDSGTVADLDENARAFIEQARAGLSPSNEAVTRLRARIDDSLQSAVPHDRIQSNPQAPAHVSWAKVGLFALGLGLGTALGYLWGQYDEERRTPESPPLAALALEPSTKITPKTKTTPSVIDSEVERAREQAPIVRPSARTYTKPTKEKTNATSSSASTPRAQSETDEILMVQRVQRALARNEPALALALLGELDARLPGGRLREERAAGKVIALCMQHSPRANHAFENFKRQFPASVHVPRTTSACNPKQPTNYSSTSDETTSYEQE